MIWNCQTISSGCCVISLYLQHIQKHSIIILWLIYRINYYRSLLLKFAFLVRNNLLNNSHYATSSGTNSADNVTIICKHVSIIISFLPLVLSIWICSSDLNWFGLSFHPYRDPSLLSFYSSFFPPFSLPISVACRWRPLSWRHNFHHVTPWSSLTDERTGNVKTNKLY